MWFYDIESDSISSVNSLPSVTSFTQLVPLMDTNNEEDYVCAITGQCLNDLGFGVVHDSIMCAS